MDQPGNHILLRGNQPTAAADRMREPLADELRSRPGHIEIQGLSSFGSSSRHKPSLVDAIESRPRLSRNRSRIPPEVDPSACVRTRNSPFR